MTVFGRSLTMFVGCGLALLRPGGRLGPIDASSERATLPPVR